MLKGPSLDFPVILSDAKDLHRQSRSFASLRMTGTSQNNLVLGLDLGTTGIRAILYDKACQPVARAYREFHQYFPKPRWVEHDPMQILSVARRVIRTAAKAAQGSPIAALGITNQRETIVVWDRISGRPIHNAIVWQCRRTSDVCARLRAKGLDSWIKQKTGLFLDPYFSATKLQWILKHVPGARRAASEGKLLAGTVDTWVLWNLTGGRVHATDPSNASRTMLWNLHDQGWDEELLRLFDIPAIMLPEVRRSTDDFGCTNEDLTGTRIPIRAVIGDQQSSMFAQGCWSPGQFKNTYGTGMFIMAHTGHKPHVAKNVVSTVAWKLGNRTEYALEGSVFIGGAAVQWLRDGIKIIRREQDTESAARQLASNEGVYFVPAFVGLGAPYWDPTARGLLIGITRGTTRAHLARAALESMAYQSAELVEQMHKELRVRPKILLADGGGSQNDFLMQFQADILGFPITRSRHSESTALGAAMLAGLQAGLWDRKKLGRMQKHSHTFTPRMTCAQATLLMKDWRRAVERSKGWMSGD